MYSTTWQHEVAHKPKEMIYMVSQKSGTPVLILR